MSYSPVMIVRVGEVVITDRSFPRQLSLTHTHKAEGGKELELVVANPDLELIDDPNFQEGVEVTWRFGYPDRLSPKYVGKIYEVNPSFDARSGMTLTLRVYDAIAEMRQQKRQKVWRATTEGEAKITESDIAERIAADYGYNIDSEATALYFSEIAQDDYDFDFMVKLTESARAKDASKNTPYRVWLSANNTLNFRPAPLYNAPRRSYRYFLDNERPELLDFRPKSKGYRPGETGVSETVVRDAGPNGATEGSATNETESGRVVSGKVIINAITGEVTTEDHKGDVEGDPGNVDPLHDSTSAQVKAGNKRNAQELKTLEASATVIGEPSIEANDTLEFLNLGLKYSGLYLVNEARHVIGQNGYQTELELGKNAIKGKGAGREGTAPGHSEASGQEAGQQEADDNQRVRVNAITGEVELP